MNLIETAYYNNQLPNPLKNQDPFIIYEAQNTVVGYSLLKELSNAITKKFAVDFSYQKLQDSEPKHVCFSPYVLKQYNSLWYVIGYSHTSKGVRTYALDRFDKWKGQSTDVFNGDDIKIVFDNLKNCIGVSLLEKEPELITLMTTSDQWPYIEKSPYHSSQDVLTRDENSVKFSLFVINNYEFRQKMFWSLGKVKVLSPVSVIEELKLEGKPFL